MARHTKNERFLALVLVEFVVISTQYPCGW